MEKLTNYGLTITLLACLLGIGNTAQAESTSGVHHPTEEIGVIGGSVSRAAFTRAVVNREPKDRISELTTDEHYLYFFTELKGMTGQKISHRWMYEGQVMAEIKFNVGATRWRVWSSKTLQTEWAGNWEVQVINELGEIIYAEAFNYINAAP